MRFTTKPVAPDWFCPMMLAPSFNLMPQAYEDAFLVVNPSQASLERMYQRDVVHMTSFPGIADELIGSITAPTLVLLGDKDVVTPAHAVEMCARIQNSRLLVLPCGHGDYIGEVTTPHNQRLIDTTIGIVMSFLHGELQ